MTLGTIKPDCQVPPINAHRIESAAGQPDRGANSHRSSNFSIPSGPTPQAAGLKFPRQTRILTIPTSQLPSHSNAASSGFPLSPPHTIRFDSLRLGVSGFERLKSIPTATSPTAPCRFQRFDCSAFRRSAVDFPNQHPNIFQILRPGCSHMRRLRTGFAATDTFCAESTKPLSGFLGFSQKKRGSQPFQLNARCGPRPPPA